ncbi:MAG: hypothetical protein RIR26_1074 [Pseudomonadota bacterium]|jgi:tetratricopeptide (TPR) repeat protein
MSGFGVFLLPVSAFVLLCLSGCGHTIALNSSPAAASVYFLDGAGNRVSLAGQTPLTLKGPPDGGPRYLLEIEKSGFVPRMLVVEQPHPFGSDTQISVHLTEQNKDWFTVAMTGAFSSETSSLIDQFFELKTRIAERSAGKVKKLETQMKDKFSGFSIFNALLGEFYFKLRNYPVATDYLQKAIELNPQDLESKLLLARIEARKK